VERIRESTSLSRVAHTEPAFSSLPLLDIAEHLGVSGASDKQTPRVLECPVCVKFPAGCRQVTSVLSGLYVPTVAARLISDRVVDAFQL
jgi:hypothetical protein